MRKKTSGVVFYLVLCVASACLAVPSLYANDGENIAYAVNGTTQIVGSVFAIPKAVVQDTMTVPFPFGIVTGALRGTVQMVGGLLGGVMNVARGTAPYAKYAAIAAV